MQHFANYDHYVNSILESNLHIEHQDSVEVVFVANCKKVQTYVLFFWLWSKLVKLREHAY